MPCTISFQQLLSANYKLHATVTILLVSSQLTYMLMEQPSWWKNNDALLPSWGMERGGRSQHSERFFFSEIDKNNPQGLCNILYNVTMCFVQACLGIIVVGSAIN